MDVLDAMFGRGGFLPHGYCFTWTPALLWTMVGADAVIAAAYFSIPAAILSFVRQRGDPGIGRVSLLFSAFIFACGLTHVMDVWTIWQPDYAVHALTKTVTAAISIVTAVMLWRLMPKALKVPTVQRLQSTVASLEGEIARRREAERQVVDIQQSLAVTLASIGAAFIATDRAGKVVRMNAVAEQLLGWTQAEARGQGLWKVFERPDLPAGDLALNPVDLILHRGTTVDEVQRVFAVSRDGRRTEVEVQAALTRAEDDSVTGLAMVFRDMTRLARAEAESSRLAAIVESSNDAIIGQSLDGSITSWNGGAEALYGYSAAEAIGRPVQMIFPPDRARKESAMFASVERGELLPTFETVRLAKDGSPREVSVTVSPIRDGAGRVVGIAKIDRNISAQRRALRLEAENRQIREASRLKSQFLANMSHELRTPLNAVIGFADLLHSGFVTPESPKHQEFLGHIGTSGRHLLQLINDVLDLSKVESGKFEFVPEPIDLPVLLKEVKDILHTEIQRKQLSIVVDLEPGLPEIKLDPARLKQVLYNYLSNAIKFSSAGGRIDVRVASEGAERVRIEVEDAGIGISADGIARLFTEFQQLDAGYSKQHQGTGLGLALTRRLVEAQGGSVGVRSVLGRGSVFHVVLPRTHGRSPQRADPPSGEPRAGAPRRLLVIEEDARDQARLVAGFTEAGYEVDAASDGSQALRRARETAYAALTLDLQMQEQPGLELLERIRDEGASRAAPVVAIAMPGDPATAATFAVADVLSKPLRSDEILAAMSRFRLPAGGRENVLVVDDDPVSLDLMRATLKSIGIDAVCFLDARAALQKIDALRPDAIVLDLMMPEFDGFQFLDALQRLPAWRDVPVFVWTSMLLSEAEYARLARSAQAVLSKGGGRLEGLLDGIRRGRLSRSAPQPQEER